MGGTCRFDGTLGFSISFQFLCKGIEIEALCNEGLGLARIREDLALLLLLLLHRTSAIQ